MNVLGRLVLPVAKQVLLDENGFLLPVLDGRWSDDRPVSVGQLLGDGGSFALLAAGGVGKTTVCQAMSGVEAGATLVNAGVLTREQLERELESRLARAPVYLDGLDQLAAHDPLALPWLEDKITTTQKVGVPWRLACRSAAWSTSLAGALQLRLPGFQEWKLLPVDRATAEEIVTAHGYDGAVFVRAVIEAGLGRLSACVGDSYCRRLGTGAARAACRRARCRRWSSKLGNCSPSLIDAGCRAFRLIGRCG